MIEKAVIDRFEGDLAVLLLEDDGSRRLDVPRSLLPQEAREGTWLKVDLEGELLLSAEIDPEALQNIRQRIEEKLARLRRGRHRKQR